MKKKTKINEDKKAILVVSSGTANAETIRLNIGACERRIADAFPGYEVRRAFTSFPVLKKLKEQEKINIDNVEEALERIIENNFSTVIIQPLHLIPGEEFHEKILKNINRYKGYFDKIICGRPLLFYMDDYVKVIGAIKKQIPEMKTGDAVVFMGHGTKHPANAAYSCLQMMMDDEGQRFYLGTIDNYPKLDHIIKRLKKENIEKVILMPFMLTAGGHANDDMAGDGDNSWKSVLEREGFTVEVYLHGLGENTAIQEIFVEHAAETVKEILK